jgi:hypothetical protein
LLSGNLTNLKKIQKNLKKPEIWPPHQRQRKKYRLFRFSISGFFEAPKNMKNLKILVFKKSEILGQFTKILVFSGFSIFPKNLRKKPEKSEKPEHGTKSYLYCKRRPSSQTLIGSLENMHTRGA